MPGKTDLRLLGGLVGLGLSLAGATVAAATETPPKPAPAAPLAGSPPAAPPTMPPIMPPPSGMPLPSSIEQVFEMLDADRDGVVTLAEALKGVGEHFDAVDQNKDGVLDRSEFDSWFGRANPDAARFFLALHDIDGDGKVTKAEFENPVKKRFALFDRNDDGKVTPEELGYAKMLMAGGPTGMLVPPMPQATERPIEPPPIRGSQPMPQYAPPPAQQYMPQSLGPAPGVYGPGGPMWTPPVGAGGPGGQPIPGYQGSGRPLMLPQGPMR